MIRIIYVWANGDWCQEEDVVEMMQSLGDDCEEVYVPEGMSVSQRLNDYFE